MMSSCTTGTMFSSVVLFCCVCRSAWLTRFLWLFCRAASPGEFPLHLLNRDGAGSLSLSLSLWFALNKFLCSFAALCATSLKVSRSAAAFSSFSISLLHFEQIFDERTTSSHTEMPMSAVSLSASFSFRDLAPVKILCLARPETKILIEHVLHISFVVVRSVIFIFLTGVLSIPQLEKHAWLVLTVSSPVHCATCPVKTSKPV